MKQVVWGVTLLGAAMMIGIGLWCRLDPADGGHGSDTWFLLAFAVLAGVGLVARRGQLAGSRLGDQHCALREDQ